jgi:hypothetical protein
MKRKGHMNQELLLVDHNHIASQGVDMEHHSYQNQAGLEMAPHHPLRKIEVTDHTQQKEVLASFLDLDSVMDGVHRRLHGCKHF